MMNAEVWFCVWSPRAAALVVMAFAAWWALNNLTKRR